MARRSKNAGDGAVRRDAPRPAPLDPFFGRRAELALLLELVDRREPLVTVVGMGGMGKTRLLSELARALAARPRPPRVVTCDLTPARDREGAARLVAHASGASSQGDRASMAAIAGSFRARGEAILVLDNCEHVADAAAEIVAELRELAPRLRVVAASRARLRLRGEAALPLPPLGLPSRVEETDASEAFSMLVERVRRARPDFEFAAAERPLAFELVNRLDGVPLAIELAAPRVATLGVRAVLDRLHRPLELLTGGPRDAAAHQRALRDSLAWSWELLSGDEQRCLAACSVFRGGFSLAAALDVAPNAAVPALDLLQSLHDQSMLQVRTLDSCGGDRRFTMLEAVREYADEKLGDGARAAARLRHARHYAAELERLTTAIEAGDAPARARLDLEMDNLRALVDRARAEEPGEDDDRRRLRAELALSALVAVDPVRLPLGWAELAEALGAFLARTMPEDSPLWARALLLGASVRWRVGPLPQAAHEFQTAFTMARHVGDRRAEGRALAGLCMVLGQQGAVADIPARLEAALEIHRACGDRRYEASTMLRLGLHHGEHGDVAVAQRYFDGARGRAPARVVWSIFDYAVVVANAGSDPAEVKVERNGAVVATSTIAPDSLATLYLPWVPELKGPDGDMCGHPVPLTASVRADGGAYHLTSSVPVTVYQFSALEYRPAGGPPGKDWSSCPGLQCNIGCLSYSNDASLLLPSTAMTGNYRITGHVFLAPDDYAENYVDILQPMGAVVTLDGATMSAPVTALGSGYGVARVPLGAGANHGAHVLTASDYVGIQVVGYGQQTSYHYPGGLNLDVIADAPPPPK